MFGSGALVDGVFVVSHDWLVTAWLVKSMGLPLLMAIGTLPGGKPFMPDGDAEAMEARPPTASKADEKPLIFSFCFIFSLSFFLGLF